MSVDGPEGSVADGRRAFVSSTGRGGDVVSIVNPCEIRDGYHSRMPGVLPVSEGSPTCCPRVVDHSRIGTCCWGCQSQRIGVDSRTRSLRALATQGRIQPARFSSGLRPGQSMRQWMSPCTSRHRQVRQLPLRQELGRATPACSAASSSGVSASAGNCSPEGNRITRWDMTDKGGRLGTRGGGMRPSAPLSAGSGYCR